MINSTLDRSFKLYRIRKTRKCPKLFHIKFCLLEYEIYNKKLEINKYISVYCIIVKVGTGIFICGLDYSANADYDSNPRVQIM